MPEQNLSGAARYLSGLMHRFGTNHYSLVFAAYNAGPKAVERVRRHSRRSTKRRSLRRARPRRVAAPLARTVASARKRLPPCAGHGLDVDYWLDGPELPRQLSQS